ncbi:hypothetical protein OSTOST_07016, partial [Ostertagia ostertagi]
MPHAHDAERRKKLKAVWSHIAKKTKEPDVNSANTSHSSRRQKCATDYGIENAKKISDVCTNGRNQSVKDLLQLQDQGAEEESFEKVENARPARTHFTQYRL